MAGSLLTAARRAGRALGYRGGFLWLLAAFDVFYGWYLASGGALEYGLFVPERAWGTIWLAVAALLAFGGTRSWDGWYFAAAVALKTAWAMEFFRFQLEYPGSLQWTRGAYFLALALIVLLASAWPEPGRGLNPTVSTLLVGIPSVLIAAASYMASRAAHREAMDAQENKVDAEAYVQARELYESAIAELRQQVTDLKTEVAGLKADLAAAFAELDALRARHRPGGAKPPGASGG